MIGIAFLTKRVEERIRESQKGTAAYSGGIAFFRTDGPEQLIPVLVTVTASSSNMTSDFEAVRRQLTNTTNGADGSNDSEVVRDTLRLYGSAFLLLFLSFCFLRQWFPRIYNVRSWAPLVKTELANEQHGFINWMWKVWRVSSEEIRDECGLDALCYLRVLQFGFRLSCVGAFNSVWLLPVYSTAEESIETEHVTDRIARVSVGNIPPGSTRFLGTVIAAYIFFGFTMYFILKEFQWFTKNRHHFLVGFSPRNYSVYVQNIPKEYRSSGDLLLFFRRIFSTEAGEFTTFIMYIRMYAVLSSSKLIAPSIAYSATSPRRAGCSRAR